MTMLYCVGWLLQFHPTPVIALLDFPRIEDYDRALEAGAAAVLSKPTSDR